MKIDAIKAEVSGYSKFLPDQLITTTVFWWLFPISIILPISFGQINLSNPKNISLWLLVGTLAHFAMFPFVIYGRNGTS